LHALVIAMLMKDGVSIAVAVSPVAVTSSVASGASVAGTSFFLGIVFALLGLG
jgi:hypothetical protein